MEINWNAVALVAGLFFYGMLAVALLRKPLKTVWEHLKALPRMAQALLAVMAVVATVEAQKPGNGGGTNEPPAKRRSLATAAARTSRPPTRQRREGEWQGHCPAFRGHLD